jgi:NUMOD3 motif
MAAADHKRLTKRHLSAAARARMSAARKGKPHPHKGVHPSALARLHESQAHLGKPHPHKGVHPSAKARADESAAQKARYAGSSSTASSHVALTSSSAAAAATTVKTATRARHAYTRRQHGGNVRHHSKHTHLKFLSVTHHHKKHI